MAAKRVTVLVLLSAIVLMPAAVLAQAAPADKTEQEIRLDEAKGLHVIDARAAAALGAALGAGLVLIGGAKGIGHIGGSAVESMARQPEAAGSINTAMIITAAMIEGATLFGVVVCLLVVLRLPKVLY